MSKIKVCPEFMHSLQDLTSIQLIQLAKKLWDKNEWEALQSVRKLFQTKYGKVLTREDLGITPTEHRDKLKKMGVTTS